MAVHASIDPWKAYYLKSILALLPRNGLLAALCDDGLILPGRGRIRLLVIPGAITTGRSFAADAGNGFFCCGGGCQKQGFTADHSQHKGSSDGIVAERPG